MNPYRKLADAVIIQAVKDYRRAGDEDAREELERFFRSDWFGVLTELDPEALIAGLRKEIEGGKKTAGRNGREEVSVKRMAS